jgi:isopentenyl-diphosphate delta-isomerase
MKITMPNDTQETRKLDHIDLALKAQITREEVDNRFYYEPLFHPHPTDETDLSLKFLGKKMNAPLWISSMTGGVGPAKHINQNLARVCKEFGLGMGLGSCRVLLDSDLFFHDFNLRPILGSELPLYANLGIAQIEQLLAGNNHHKITDLIARLDADGLIVHINPLQEWFQPEGDRLKSSPIETLTKLCAVINTKLIVKEVGQGLGPKSLKALLDLPIDAIELAAFGGTNFTKLEQLRGKNLENFSSFAKVGHTAIEMISFLNSLALENVNYRNKEIIISGGVEGILDGFHLLEKLNFNSVIGQAKNFLKHAEDYEDLKKFTATQVNGLKLAKVCLMARNQETL